MMWMAWIGAGAAWIVGMALLAFAMRWETQGPLGSAKPGVVMGGVAMVVGAGILLASSVLPPSGSPSLPSSPVARPAPALWPETLLTTELHRPHPDPVFRKVHKFTFRHARWLQFDDRVQVVLDHRETPPHSRCAADPSGTNHTLEVRFLDPDGPALGEHVVSAMFSQGSVGRRYELVGTVAVGRVQPDRLAVDVMLRGTGRNSSSSDTVQGPITAEVVDCRTPKPPPEPKEGPSAVQYSIASREGQVFEGTLTYANLLVGTELGDLLVFRHGPEPGCNPRSRGPDPLNAIWITQQLPAEAGEMSLRAGYSPGAFMIKTWTYVAPESSSYNFGIEGSVEILERTEALLRGEIDVEVVDSEHELVGKPGPYGRGRIQGPFEAQLVDCSSWKGPYPI